MNKPLPKGTFNIDGYANLLAGIGAANPKTAADDYIIEALMSGFANLDIIYRTSTWFGKIVDIPADDATREWRSWKGSPKEIEAIENVENLLGLRSKVRSAIIQSRVYGGCALLPGGLPGDASTPLILDQIKPNSLTFLTLVPKEKCNGGELETDPFNSGYGGPKFYTIGNQRFHHSRVIRFTGRDVLDQIWGDSIWMSLSSSIKAADGAAAVLDGLLKEAKSDVIKIDDLMSGLATEGYETLLLQRFRTAMMMKSSANVTLLDKADEWEQKQITWTGLPEVIGVLLTIMAGAADIPVTRLLGTSAKGLNATGDGDLKNYYDQVKAQQELKITPMLMPLDEMIKRSAGVDPVTTWYSWKSLWQISAKEAADIEKVMADAAAVLVNAALIPDQALAESVQNRMIESGQWPGLETGLATYGKETESIEHDDPFAMDAQPLSLYVRRDVINVAEITKWAKAQGFKDIVTDMHVTIMYSTAPVDWMKCGQPWQAKLEIAPGGPRMVETFGKGAQVLLFVSDELKYRHERMAREGAEPSYVEYQPHITISYSDMPKNVTPYQGKIILGPEIFEEVK